MLFQYGPHLHDYCKTLPFNLPKANYPIFTLSSSVSWSSSHFVTNNSPPFIKPPITVNMHFLKWLQGYTLLNTSSWIFILRSCWGYWSSWPGSEWRWDSIFPALKEIPKLFQKRKASLIEVLSLEDLNYNIIRSSSADLVGAIPEVY